MEKLKKAIWKDIREEVEPGVRNREGRVARTSLENPKRILVGGKRPYGGNDARN